MTKADIAGKVAIELDVQKQFGKELVDSFFEEVVDLLCDDTDVKLSGFGNFDLHDKRARPGRNPKTGEAVPISARRVVTFKAGQKLKMIISH